MITSHRGQRNRPAAPTQEPTSRNTAPRQFSLTFVLVTNAALVALSLLAGARFMRSRIHADPVLAAVNGATITRAAFTQRLETVAGSNTLRDMINEELQLQFARKKGFAPQEPQVQAWFDRAARQPDFRQHLQQNHETPERVKRRIRVGLAMAAVLAQGMMVSEAEVQQYYQAQTARNNPSARYYTPETVGVQIVVTSNQAQAEQASAALKNGVPFDEVAQRYSLDSSRASGGRIAPLQHGRTRLSGLAGLEAAIFALKVGETLGPRRYGPTWWIVHCLDRAPEQTVPLAVVEDECRTAALIAKASPIHGRQVMGEFAEFKRHAVVQMFDPSYETVVNAR